MKNLMFLLLILLLSENPISINAKHKKKAKPSPPPPKPPVDNDDVTIPKTFNVLSYGVKGNGVGDDTNVSLRVD